MDFLIDDYLLKYTDELTFINIKEGAQLQLENFDLPIGGIDVPIITKELADNIQTRNENEIITVGSIVRGIIYLLGIDSKFKYRKKYKELLYAANPDIEKYIFQSAIKSIQEDDFLNSLIYFKALLLLKPNDIQALLNYAIILIQYRDNKLKNRTKTSTMFINEARDKLEILLNIDDEQALGHYFLGFLHEESKSYNLAKFHWEKAITLDLDVDLKNSIAENLNQMDDMVQYENGYEAILSGKPHEGLTILMELEKKYENWWNLLFFIGLAHRQLGIFHEAVKYFNRVLDISKNQIDTLVELGLSYAGLGEIQKAIKTFHMAIEIDKNNSEILCNLAMLYFELGNIEKAQEYISESLKINPNDETSLLCSKQINGGKQKGF